MKTRYHSERGSVLLTTMILSLVMAMVVTSYLSLSLFSMRSSHRYFNHALAINLAETGIEEALWAMNNGGIASSGSWTKLNSTEATQTVNLGADAKGTVKVYVRNYDGVTGDPVVVAHATVPLPIGTGKVERWIEVSLKKGVLPTNNKPTSIDPAKLSGQPEFCSWDSDPDNDPSTPPVPYSLAVRHDNGGLAAMGIELPGIDINLSNGTIWGTAAVGSNTLDAIKMGKNSIIGPFGTEPGKMPGASTDFSVSLPNARQPQTAANETVLTIPADYQLVGSNEPGKPTIYSGTSLTLQNKALQVTGYVELRLNAIEGTSAISIGGSSGAINIDATIGPIVVPVDADKPNGATHVVQGASSGLTIYTAGNIAIGGNGIANQYTDSAGKVVFAPPLGLQVYGTGETPGTQSISISGNGALSGVIYAPNANVTLNGGGNSGVFFGTAIAKSLTFNGSNIQVIFDEAILRAGQGRPLRTGKWRELTSVEATGYASKI